MHLGEVNLVCVMGHLHTLICACISNTIWQKEEEREKYNQRWSKSKELIQMVKVLMHNPVLFLFVPSTNIEAGMCLEMQLAKAELISVKCIVGVPIPWHCCRHDLF